MQKKIIGRTDEFSRLDDCMNSNKAQLVIVYGRRRVGKTFLINEYFNNNFAFKLTGAYGKDKSVQLRNFASELKRKQFNMTETPKDWIQAFEVLRDYIESLPNNKKQVIFFDEMPWLDNQKSDFLSSFEWFWNDWASTKSNLIFIVCGSASSWMDEKIANNKGGLFNRQTCRLYLKPFKLSEVEEYLLSNKIKWSRYDIVRCYMIMGGIPYYLKNLRRGASLSQNVDEMFFAEKGRLDDEFDALYNSLFEKSENYIKVVEALSTKNKGLTREEILQATKLEMNGHFSKILQDLVDCEYHSYRDLMCVKSRLVTLLFSLLNNHLMQHSGLYHSTQ